MTSFKSYCIAFFLFLSTFSFGQTFEKKQAENIVANSKLVSIDEHSKTIKFIKLRDDFVYAASKQAEWLNKSLKLKQNHKLHQIYKKTDNTSITHEKYQFYFKNLPVEGAVYTVHSKNGKIYSANGDYTLGQDISTTPGLNEQEAFAKAIQHVNAKTYKWEIENISRPAGELIILPVDTLYILTYKFDIYAVDPLTRQYVFINANTGQVIKTLNRIHVANAIGTAKTMYNGTVSITTDSYNGSYRLRETGRGNGIETYNLNHGYSYSSAVDFTDNDNNWTDTVDYNHAANDAHFATEATYDYYYTKFGRNSYDDKGAKMLSYVHYGTNYVNAFWDGTCMTYGDGNGVTYLPLTPIEVVAHEITHGVTEHSAGLIYSQESGALNESFSDIFGIVIDFFKNPATANYLMGDAMSVTHTPFRSMQNPNAYGDPDTYHGLYWDPYQEVHTNSGVMNYWFYLLSEGGSGANDIGSAYSVTGIGREKAAKIAYRSLTVYLTPSATFADARFYAIQAASDLFGDCSQEVISVTNAWYAVGVGNMYDNSVIADFTVSKTNACDTSSPVYFFNRSSKASSFKWDFGDGKTDTAKNSAHIYRNTGTYSVQLIAEGASLCNNSDTIIKNNVVNVANGIGTIEAECIPYTLYPGSGGIYQITFDSINHTSNGSADGYRDYTCSYQTTVTEGKDYLLYVKVGQNHSENVKLWIDTNNDGKFNNTGELVFQNSKVTNECYEHIIIPASAQYNTPLRLRIGSDFTEYPLVNACSNTNFGQYQDYKIYIQPNHSKPKANFKSDKQLIAKGDSINFNDFSLNVPTSWLWSFPGGTPSTSTLQNPVVKYNSAGTYDISLVVSNAYGRDTIVQAGYVKVLDQLYCTSSLGGSGVCPGDISLVSIKGTTLNNTSHTNCVIANGSTYASYSSTGSTTATLDADTTYEISVTTTSSDIISVWIDYDQNGVFEASEWKQVSAVSTPNLPSKVNLKIPSTALRGKTGMRIRSRANGNPNGAGDACTHFGSGITEDYFITINNLPRPKNFTASVKNHATGEVRLDWTYSSSINNSALPANISSLTFSKFLIYRNGVIKDSTTNTSYTDMLPGYGDYRYEISAVYDAGVSKPSDSKTIGWYGEPQIYVSPVSFNEVVMKGDSITRTMTISNTGNGLLIFNINKNGVIQFNPISFTTESLTKEEKTFVNQNSTSESQTSEVETAKRITSNLNTGNLQNILVYEGTFDSNTPYDNVLNKLGLSRTFVNTWSGLNSQLSGGIQWDLVIVNSYSSIASTSDLNLLETYRSNGGKLIYADWGIGQYTSHALLTGLGIQWVNDIFTPLNFFAVDESHPVFNNPNKINQLNWSLNQANRDGQIVNVLNGASRLAQFEGYPNSGAIVLGSAGKSIYNGFQAVNFTRDDNSNGINDVEELIENEITFLNKGGSSQKWISVNPASDTLSSGQTTVVNVKFNAKDLNSDSYRDTITIASTALLQPKVKVGCNLKVLGEPTGEFKVNKRTIMVGNNVKFSDLSTGEPTQWNWILQGGAPSTTNLQNPTITYDTVGNYDVSLIASNNYGSDTVVKQDYITVLPQLVANFSASTTNATVGSYVYFYSTGTTGNPTSWKWTFQGGSPSTSTYSSPSVVYNTPGLYDVKLVVSNAAGSDSVIKTGYITVTLPPKPVASFTSGSTNITVGSYVSFYDNSTNNPTSRKWTFQGGSPSTSTYSSPSAKYDTPGVYDVKLVVSNAGGSDSVIKTGYITVTLPPKPVASFTSGSTNTTIGSYVYFYDNSTNNPTSRKWTFQGGSPSTSTYSNPSVKYDTPGVYDVKLVVSNAGGSDSIIKTGYITATLPPKPVADFYASSNLTRTGLSIYFYDNSSNSPTSRQWTFSGGTPATSVSGNPSVVYNAPGIYDVKLRVSNAGGSDSVIKTGYVTITLTEKPVANFYASQSTVITGNYVYFTNNSANYPTSWKWTFTGGSPSTSTSSSPGVSYNAPGTYDVKLVVSNASGSDSITKTGYITVNLPPKPVAAFSAGSTNIKPGSYVSFSDLSTNNPTSRKWTFSGGSPSASTSTSPYVSYSTPGTYDVKLVVTNAGGSDSITKTGYINVSNNSPGDSCNNAQDLSLLTSPYSSSTSGYKANFTLCSMGAAPDRVFYIDVPNGNTLTIGQTSNNFNSRHSVRVGGSCPGTTELFCYDDPDTQNHTYNNTTGSTQRVYFILGGFGSSYGDFTLAWKLTYSAKPVANFAADKTTTQRGSYVYFSDQSTGIPSSWKWYFSGGSPSSSTSSGPSVYYSTPGTYDVKLVVTNSHGSDSLTKVGYITVTPPPKPVASFSASPTVVKTGSNAYFYDNSTNSPTSWKWSFEGGTPSSSTSSSATVVYNTPGLYTAKLSVSNASGSDSIIKIKYITVSALQKPVANFYTNNSIVIIGNNASFYSNSGNNPTSWKWTFTGGTPSSSTSSSPYVTYNTLGAYDVKLVVSNAAGSDSITKTGYINVVLPPKPVADFYTYLTTTTAGSYVYFYNNSKNSPTSFKWTFPGGTPSSSTSSYAAVVYNSPGKYDVKLVVSNAGGSDSITKSEYITVNLPPRPVADFYGSPTTTTERSSVYFYCNSSNNPNTWKWSFPGGSPATSVTNYANVVYNTPGTYNVKLVVSNAGGADSITKVGYITITSRKPVASFSSSANNITVGTKITFYDNSTNSPASRKWTFPGGNPSSSTLSSPSVTYNTEGVFNVKLVVSNAWGSDSIIKSGYIKVTIPKPAANFASTATNISVGSSVSFFDNSTNTPVSWKWTFSGANPSSSTIKNPSVVYNVPGKYSIKLVVTNSWGTDSITKAGYISVLTPNFKANITTVCEKNSVQFTDLTSGYPTSWYWTFAGGSPATSTLQNPVVEYATQGTMTVSLTVNGVISKTMNNFITVNNMPAKALIFKENDNLVSSASAGNQWYSVVNGLVKDAVDKKFKPAQTGNYFVIVTEDGCSSASSDTINYVATGNQPLEDPEITSVYPLPVTQFLNIESEKEIESIEISGIAGNTVIQLTSLSSKKLQIDMSSHSSGTYILKVFLAEKPKNPVIRKIIKD